MAVELLRRRDVGKAALEMCSSRKSSTSIPTHPEAAAQSSTVQAKGRGF